MPTYEYRCESCGHTFDIVQGFSDDPLTTCEVCGAALRKVYAPVGIVFKGSGFYKTDSRSSGSRSGAAAPTGTDKPAKESTAATSDSAGSTPAPAAAAAPAATKEAPSKSGANPPAA